MGLYEWGSEDSSLGRLMGFYGLGFVIDGLIEGRVGSFVGFVGKALGPHMCHLRPVI